MSTYPTGFIYVLSNPTMPGILKIGRTDRLIADRANELQSTGVALPFEVEYGMMTSYPKDVEKATHKILADYRVAPNREYFRTDVATAAAAVQEGAEYSAGIDRWTTELVHDIWCGDRLTLSMRAGQLLLVMHYPDHHAYFGNQLDILDIWEAHSDGDRLDLMGATHPEHVVGMEDYDSPHNLTDPIPHLDHAGRIRNASINGKERLLPGERLLWLSGGPEWQSVQWALFEIGDYCQVVSRTWTPQTTNGSLRVPLLLNTPEHLPGQIPLAMRRAVDKAKAAATVPGTWISRYSDYIDKPLEFGTAPLSSDQWLRGLIPRSGRRRR